MKNVTITGADGFVGSYTVKHFLNEGKTVLALDMGPSARRLEEHPNLKYMQCDISDTKAMLDGIAKGEMTLLFISQGRFCWRCSFHRYKYAIGHILYRKHQKRLWFHS